MTSGNIVSPDLPLASLPSSFSNIKKGEWVGGSGQNLSNLPGVFMFVYIFLGQPSAGFWLVAGGADP